MVLTGVTNTLLTSERGKPLYCSKKWPKISGPKWPLYRSSTAYLYFYEVGLCLYIIKVKIFPLCFLAFPKFFAYYAHFYICFPNLNYADNFCSCRLWQNLIKKSHYLTTITSNTVETIVIVESSC